MHKLMHHANRVISMLILSTVLSVAFPVARAENNTYELWTESPYITSGISSAYMNIHRALNLNVLEAHRLSRINENLWFVTCQDKYTNGGQGSSKNSDLYFYTMLVNGSDVVILSEFRSRNEHSWDSGLNFMDLSETITNPSWYPSNGYDTPYYIMTPRGVYNFVSGYGEYAEYYIITKTGKVGKFEIYTKSGSDQLIIMDGILYVREDYYYKSSSGYYVRYLDSATNKNYTLLYPLIVGDDGVARKDANKVIQSFFNDTKYTLTEPHTPFTLTSNTLPENYYKVEGSENLFFTAGRTTRVEPSDGKTYYDVLVKVYTITNGKVTPKNERVYKTKDTNTGAAIDILNLGTLDREYYQSKNSLVPRHIIYGKIVINEDGSIVFLDPERIDSATYVTWNFSIYQNRLSIIRARNGTSTVHEPNPDNYGNKCYWQMINWVYMKDGNILLESDILLPIGSSAKAGQNGHFTSTSSFTKASLTAEPYASEGDWLITRRTNVFPDGRSVNIKWIGLGSSVYEIWYDIFNSDGTRRATGATGQSSQYSSSFNTPALTVFTINNSKFVIAINVVGHSFLREYYRIAVVNEESSGEISTPGGSGIGTKNITPPTSADTIPIQPQIDFGEQDLPLGYNINPNLKNDINSIILPDIVIVKKSGYTSGVINTGRSIDGQSASDSSMGSIVYFTGNGSNLVWSCNYPENLSVGVHNKTLILGDKTLYLRIKVITTPTNGGNTTVVF